MFESFSDGARRVVVLAQEEARLLDHGWIGTEHLLPGLLADRAVADPSAAATPVDLLVAGGLTLDRARADVEAALGRGDQPTPDPVPFTPRAKAVLELSLREALQLGHRVIVAGQILAALLREGEGVAAQIVASHFGELTGVLGDVRAALPGRRDMAIAMPTAGPVSPSSLGLPAGASPRAGCPHPSDGLRWEHADVEGPGEVREVTVIRCRECGTALAVLD